MLCKGVSQQFSEKGESGTSPLFLHSDCWYLVEKGHCEERHAALQDKGVGNSWMVSLQIQTFRNSFTQRRKVVAVAAFRDAQGRAARLVQSLCHPQPVLSTFGRICCQILNCLCQDSVGGVQPSTAPFPCPRQQSRTELLSPPSHCHSFLCMKYSSAATLTASTEKEC